MKCLPFSHDWKPHVRAVDLNAAANSVVAAFGTSPQAFYWALAGFAFTGGMTCKRCGKRKP